jgi:hypothetical protein
MATERPLERGRNLWDFNLDELIHEGYFSEVSQD